MSKSGQKTFVVVFLIFLGTETLEQISLGTLMHFSASSRAETKWVKRFGRFKNQEVFSLIQNFAAFGNEIVTWHQRRYFSTIFLWNEIALFYRD